MLLCWCLIDISWNWLQSVLLCRADIMDQKHKQLLTSKRVFLVEHLDMPELIDHMIQTGLLSNNDKELLEVLQFSFWQRVSIACYAERCLSYGRFCLTVRPSVWPSVTVWYHAKTTPATIMRSSLEDSPMSLVSWWLTSARNSKGNIGSEGAEWERGSENVAKIGNF